MDHEDVRHAGRDAFLAHLLRDLRVPVAAVADRERHRAGDQANADVLVEKLNLGIVLFGFALSFAGIPSRRASFGVIAFQRTAFLREGVRAK
ncbi:MULTISPECIES: hypothetical protein [unclassified Bradyrhizobium]|uniref:hypothetical protein n=1 Tax=unclassified Bradyrhizobium TaxID=2631580 RepID=UPI002FF0E7E6